MGVLKHRAHRVHGEGETAGRKQPREKSRGRVVGRGRGIGIEIEIEIEINAWLGVRFLLRGLRRWRPKRFAGVVRWVAEEG